MIEKGESLTLSTHRNNMPSAKLLSMVSVFFLAPGCLAFFLALFVYGISLNSSIPYSIVYMLFLVVTGFIIVAIGISQLKVVMIRMDENGVMIQKGRKRDHAQWSEFQEIKATFTIGGGLHIFLVPVILFRTHRWKQKVYGWKFPTYELKNAFNFIAWHIKPLGIPCKDRLHWLRSKPISRQQQYIENLRGHKDLVKGGLVLLILGPIIFILGISGGQIWMLGALFFIGGIVSICVGVTRSIREKNRYKKRSET